MIAPDSATVIASSVSTGDLPSGCTRVSSGGASIVFASRWYFWISYGTPSSSSSQRTRCERELLRWWTVIMRDACGAAGRRIVALPGMRACQLGASIHLPGDPA